MLILSPIMLCAATTLLLGAALHDIAARTIPHWTVAGILALGVVRHCTTGTLAEASLAALIVFGVCVVLWRMGWFGGGDAKLLGAVALILPPAAILPALVAIAMTGAGLTAPYLLLRGRIALPAPGRRGLPLLVRSWRAERFRLRRGGPLPYGVAIAAGAVLTLWSTAA